MKTRKFCPHCGRPLYKAKKSATEDRFPFECFACDQFFFRFEVFTTREIEEVRRIRKIAHRWEVKNGYKACSFKKPYPRPSMTKHQRVNNHGKIKS